MATLDEIAPTYVATRRLRLTLSDPQATPRAFDSVDIDVSIDTAADADGVARAGGLSPPIVVTVKAPSAAHFERHVFYRTAPAQISFTPREGGEHLVSVRELAHNRFFGSLVVSVAGERLNIDADS
jgi:hypothetical protein